ncbi:MAG TPA: hypothetical protein VMU84_04300, partial [Thermoanaerobaculia bacterium]|nr:hypothetical protein [Thermoanaerobaculia bacterium]
MRKLLALCVLGIAGAAHAQTPSAADLEKGLTNLAIIHDVAFSIEFQRNSTGNARLSNISDPWGTPYRLESTPGGSYRIVSAGSDKTFDEQSWATHVQFDGLAGDVVFADGGVRRTNRNWLATRV